MRYRLVKMEQAESLWWIIQKKHWFFGWILISDPLFKRIFDNEKEAIEKYNYFIESKKKPKITVICENNISNRIDYLDGV